MIRSMTGFGEAERATLGGLLRVEMKTVNHRGFNASIRTPYGFDRFEPQIQGWIREFVSRGHVTVSVSLDTSAVPSSEPVMDVDLEKARQYRDLLHRVRRELGLDGEVTLEMLARYRDIFQSVEPSRDVAPVEEAELEGAVRDAALALVAMRDREGEALGADLGGRLDAMEEHLAVVAEQAPARLLRERDRLRAAVEELSQGVGVDEERLAREIAYLAEKWDINEEIVRFRSHIEVFRETLERSAGEAAGKRLGFLVQEMLREANTIGSKANDAEISRRSVALKEEIERLREQLENVE